MREIILKLCGRDAQVWPSSEHLVEITRRYKIVWNVNQTYNWLNTHDNCTCSLQMIGIKWLQAHLKQFFLLIFLLARTSVQPDKYPIDFTGLLDSVGCRNPVFEPSISPRSRGRFGIASTSYCLLFWFECFPIVIIISSSINVPHFNP